MAPVAECRGIVSLEPLHEWVARIVFDLPQARSIAIAGGNAMLAHELVVRPTQDLDLFTPASSDPRWIPRLPRSLTPCVASTHRWRSTVAARTSPA